MKVLIFGGGAVGLGIGSCLIKAGADVDIFDRKPVADALRQNGLFRKGIFGEYHARAGSFGASDSMREMAANVYDYILICTKSYDTASAAGLIKKELPGNLRGTKFMLVQNGWGNAGIFEKFFPKTRIYSARVITGFAKGGPDEVDITVHADAIHLGSLYNANVSVLKDLCVLISKGGIPCELTDAIEKDLWAKMLYNCLLNPLGAILNVPYGKLGESDNTREIMKNIADEIFEVIKKSGYKTHWDTSAGYLEAFYRMQLPPTAKHESSMLQDIKAARRTEIDAMNGEVVRLGDQHGVDVKTNRTICNIIKFIEGRYL